MKIASASLDMASAHASQQRHELSESLRMWVGPRPAAAEPARQPPPPSATVSLSEAGQAAAATPDETLEGDPKLQLIRLMLQIWLGHDIELIDPSELEAAGSAPAAPAAPAAPPAAGWGIEYERHESYSESEQTRFAASGVVNTADGRQLSFKLELEMARAYHEESSLSLRLGDAARKTDPLVLNFAGTAARLTDQRFAFDLNADGTKEQINFVASGSGFLVFDRNRDGQVNDGSELFGPASNDGFAELAGLDQDNNGWIDENDASFAALQVWERDPDGKERLRSLDEAGVGAIALSRIATPFDIKTNDNELLGQIRTSGIFLQEDGSAGTIQQVDLTA